jgi:hypothetical protein
MINGKNGYKITLAKVVGKVIVALLGLVGTVLGLYFGQQIEQTDASLEMVVQRMDDKVIPAMQILVDDLRKDNKSLIAMLDVLRERVHKLEETRTKTDKSLPAMAKRPKQYTIQSFVSEPAIPPKTSKVQSQKLIPKVNFEQVQQQVQEGF